MINKITVVGGSGFVGTNLCRELSLKQKNFEIIDLRMSTQFTEQCKIGDVRDIDSLRSTITGEIVIVLAAVHRDDVRDKLEYHRTNVEGAENIIKVCKEKGIKQIIFTSTVAVYGFADPQINEDGEIKPFNEYGRSKFHAEERFRAWRVETDSKLIIIRPTVIFGEGNRGNVYNLFKQIASGKFLMIGKGKNKKSVAYIGNVVAFLEGCILTKKKYGLYNYVDTPDFTMNDLVSLVQFKLFSKKNSNLMLPYWFGMFLGYVFDAIIKISGKSLPVSSIRVKKFVSSSEFKSSKSDLDDFVPPFSLETGINRTLQCEFISPNMNQEIFFTE